MGAKTPNPTRGRKVKKKPEFADRIKKLRVESRDESQEQLAELLGVSRAAVSGWEAGDYPPSADTYVRLAGLAADPFDALYFLGMGGLRPHTILGASIKLTKDPRAAMQGKVLVVDEKTAGLAFSAGDIVALDEAVKDPRDPRPFWNQIVLVKFSPRAERMPGYAPELWPDGLFMGRLRCKRYSQSDLQFVATLGPFGDSEPFWRGGYELLVVGGWSHPGPPKEPVGGSPREKALREVEKAYGRVREIVDQQLGGPFRGGVIMPTPELDAAREADADARNRLFEAEQAEKEQAQTEAKQQGPEMVRLYEGCNIIGRATAWFPAIGNEGKVEK